MRAGRSAGFRLVQDVIAQRADALDLDFDRVAGLHVELGRAAEATPAGVPEKMMSPACSVMAWLTVEITVATSNSMSVVLADCTVAPFSRVSRRSPRPPGGSSSAVTT